jgi:hypothetical protein
METRVLLGKSHDNQEKWRVDRGQELNTGREQRGGEDCGQHGSGAESGVFGVPRHPVAPKLLPRLNPTCSVNDEPRRPPPTPPPTSNPRPVFPWRFQGARAAPDTWDEESTTNLEGIGSLSPEQTVSPSISSPASSVGEALGAAASLRERAGGRRNGTRKQNGR